MSTTHKIKTFHALLNSLGLRDQKATMVQAYGVESTKDLTDAQLDKLINSLRRMQKSPQTPPEIRRGRSTVLDLLTRLGVYKDNRDWNRVNKYLLNPRICGKLLYELDKEELKSLAKKLRAILKKQEDKIQQEAFWAANN